MPSDTCDTCRFSAQGKVPGKLDCRRHPPIDVARHDASEWPRVAPGAWCGDYESRPAKPARAKRPAKGEVETREQG